MDNFGGVNPNPTDFQPNTNPQQPMYADPGMVAPEQQGFASVPMTDPNTPGQMMPPAQPPMMQQMAAPTPVAPSPMDTMLDPQPLPVVASGGGKGKVILFVVITVVLILGAGAGGYFAGYASGKQAGKTESDAAYQAEQAKQAESSSDSSSSDTKSKPLDLKDPKDPGASDYVDQSLDGAIGETVRSADGFVLRINNIERNYTTDDPAYTLKEGKELVKVNFDMGNATKTFTRDWKWNVPFSVIDSTEATLMPETIASYDGKFDVVHMEPGSQSSGSLIFAVNKDEKPLKFVRKQQYTVKNLNKTVTFETVITLTK